MTRTPMAPDLVVHLTGEQQAQRRSLYSEHPCRYALLRDDTWKCLCGLRFKFQDGKPEILGSGTVWVSLAMIPAKPHPRRGPYRPRIPKKEKPPVTVCIAAVCNDGYSIVLAADRMITARGTEFEIPGLSKLSQRAPILKTVPLNKHLIAMTSGDAGFQNDAMQHMFTRINPKGFLPETPSENKFSSTRVRDAAKFYLEFCDEQRKAATNSLLAPYGLTAETYIEKQKLLNDGFVTWISSEVEATRVKLGDPVLFCGIDDTGTHIIQCDGNQLSVCDSFAFAAIGSGGDHAEAQFMLANHTRFASISDTIMLTYLAKKRSEVAQGVGEQTDMFIISATAAGYFYVMAEQFEKLETVYRAMERDQAKAFDRAKAKVKAYVERLAESAASAEAVPSALEDGNAQRI